MVCKMPHENFHKAVAVKKLDNDSSEESDTRGSAKFDSPHLYKSRRVNAFVFKKKYSVD